VGISKICKNVKDQIQKRVGGERGEEEKEEEGNL
jgi:hypothetical protein